MKVIQITGDVARQAAIAHIMAAPVGHVVKIGEAQKKREQEEKYHAMIGKIAKRVEFFGMKRDEETVKRLLIDAFVRVMRELASAEGKPDPFPIQGTMLPSLNGAGIVQLGVQSRKFTVKQASDFIEYLYSFAASKGVEL